MITLRQLIADSNQANARQRGRRIEAKHTGSQNRRTLDANMANSWNADSYRQTVYLPFPISTPPLLPALTLPCSPENMQMSWRPSSLALIFGWRVRPVLYGVVERLKYTINASGERIRLGPVVPSWKLVENRMACSSGGRRAGTENSKGHTHPCSSPCPMPKGSR